METLVIAGLGNPGPGYARSRHNLGYDVLDLLARRHGASFRPRVRGLQAVFQADGRNVVLVKPTTFMNLSGQAIAPLLRRKGLGAAALLVVHDDLDLPTGRVRLRRSGSAGGHRGVQSIIDLLGTTEFARLKIGIGRPPAGTDPMDYVLLRPTPGERAMLDAAMVPAADACEIWWRQGIEAAMNMFNAADGNGIALELPVCREGKS